MRLVTSNKREFLIWHCINYQTQPHDQISSTVKMTQVRTLNILCVWCDPHNKRFRCILLVNILRSTCERALKFIASRDQHLLLQYIVKIQSVIVQTMTCYRQTCTQIITGRNLNYRRALKVVQNEEYLMVTDLEIIRRLYEGGIRTKFDLVFHRILKKNLRGITVGQKI